MKLKNTILLSIALTTFFSCKKDKKSSVSEPILSPAPADTSLFVCKNLPPAPQPFGWRDSSVNEDKNINTFMYNPANPNEIIYVVEGDIFGYNKMFSLDVPTKKTTFLASISDFPPQINKYGWILYSTLDDKVYKIKTNGDSLKKLTFGNRSKDPKWDFTNQSFYIFQKAYNSFPNILAKFDANSNPLLNYPVEMANTAAFKKSDKIIYLKSEENTLSLILRDNVAPNIEKKLVTVAYNPTESLVYFDNLTLDNNDENVYWSNSTGIIKCNLNSLKVDTVLKNCQNLKYDNPIFQGVKPNVMMLSCNIIENINSFQLLNSYVAIEYNLTTKEKTVIKIFP